MGWLEGGEGGREERKKGLVEGRMCDKDWKGLGGSVGRKFVGRKLVGRKFVGRKLVGRKFW